MGKIAIKIVFSFFGLASLVSCKQTYNTSHNYIRSITLSNAIDVSIIDVFDKFDKENVIRNTNEKLYRKLKDSVIWYEVDVSSFTNKKDVFFTIRDAYLEGGEAYFVSSNHIDSLYSFDFDSKYFIKSFFYKSPTWKIQNTWIKENARLYFKIEPHFSNNRLEFFLEEENNFLRRMQLEYLLSGVYVSFVFSLLIVLTFFSILKREYSILFFALYLSFMMLDYLAMRGISIQFLWPTNHFIKRSYSLLHVLAMISISLFYANFYSFNRKTFLIKRFFLGTTIFLIGLLFVVIYAYIANWKPEIHELIWLILKVILICYIGIHLFLAKQKVIPKYLSTVFTINLIVVIFFHSYNPSVTISDFFKYTLYNLRHILYAIEILAVTRFIFSETISSQTNLNKLLQVNEDLKNSFQQSLLETQMEERNAILGNVHDSFGGYLESFKIRISMNPSPKQMQEIVDAFYQEYRILLNNIYSPKVDNDNFKQYLIKYLNKIELLNVLSINYNVNLGSYDLSSEACIHLYRIISESFTNILKHAKATEATLYFSANGKKELELIISDNGIGFKEEVLKSLNSYGFKSIEERVEKIGGVLKINSDSKRGTTLKIILDKRFLD